MAWVYVSYTPWNMLDIPQQNPLKYAFIGIEEGHKICEFDRNWPSGYRDTRCWKQQVSGSCK